MHHAERPDDFTEKTFEVEDHLLFYSVDRWYKDDKLAIEPNPQNWYALTHLKRLKESNPNRRITMVPEGKFPDQDTIGTPGKVTPINEGDDPLLLTSWHKAKRHGRLMALILTEGNRLDEWELEAAKNELENSMWFPSWIAPNIDDYFLTGLLGAGDDHTGWNEFNHRWNKATRIMGAEEDATCFYAFCEGWRSVDDTVTLLPGGPISPDLEYQEDFWARFEELGGKRFVNLGMNFHYYMRLLSKDQQWIDSDRGATPEEVDLIKTVEDYDLTFGSLLLKGFDLQYWRCTETGWGAPDTSYQRAPELNGLTQMESQVACIIRAYMTMCTSPYFGGMSVYCERDPGESPPYKNMGLFYHWSTLPGGDWTQKESWPVFINFYRQYAFYTGEILQEGTITKFLTGDKVFEWSDQNPFPHEKDRMISLGKYFVHKVIDSEGKGRVIDQEYEIIVKE